MIILIQELFLIAAFPNIYMGFSQLIFEYTPLIFASLFQINIRLFLLNTGYISVFHDFIPIFAYIQ